jgi:hypothetical protein
MEPTQISETSAFNTQTQGNTQKTIYQNPVSLLVTPQMTGTDFSTHIKQELIDCSSLYRRDCNLHQWLAIHNVMVDENVQQEFKNIFGRNRGCRKI